MTAREAILQALHALLQTQPAPALRGEVLPERVPTTGLLILRDGEPGRSRIKADDARMQMLSACDVHGFYIGQIVVTPWVPASFGTAACGRAALPRRSGRRTGPKRRQPRSIPPCDGAARS